MSLVTYIRVLNLIIKKGETMLKSNSISYTHNIFNSAIKKIESNIEISDKDFICKNINEIDRICRIEFSPNKDIIIQANVDENKHIQSINLLSNMIFTKELNDYCLMVLLSTDLNLNIDDAKNIIKNLQIKKLQDPTHEANIVKNNYKYSVMNIGGNIALFTEYK